MSGADEEKHAAIMELKSKFDQNNSKLKQLDAQVRQNQINLKRAAVTAAYLNELPEDIPTYNSVGKAYFLEPKNSIMSQLEEFVTSTGTELKSINSIEENLRKTQEGIAKELQEMIGSFQKKT